ncbi:MAG: thermonuclease family protein [Patescibacteria group bacterium]
MAKKNRHLSRLQILVGLVITLLIAFGLIDTELLQPAPSPQAETAQVSPTVSSPPSADSQPENPATDEADIMLHVARVVDGDTIELSNGDMVRYIGVDTPETRHPRKGLECFGKEATAYNTSLVLGKSVRLEQDVSSTDRYGRVLAYVFVESDSSASSELSAGNVSESLQQEDIREEIFVNAQLVQDGYAVASSYPPDVAYDDLFAQLETEAREAERGLWSACR